MRQITINESPSGFAVIVDGAEAGTPLGRHIILPNAALAEAVAAEWRAQGKVLRKETMPLTQIACVAIDFAERRKEVYADILSYCDTDVVCYRAGDIPELLAEQATLLEPVLAWMQQRYGIGLAITHGIMPVAQESENRAKIASAISAYGEWQLAVLASFVKPLSSLALSLAVMERHLDAERAFHLSHLEEIYETKKWGEDDEKEAKMQRMKQDVLAAESFLKML